MVESRLRLASAGPGRKGGAALPFCHEHFVEESLPNLVDNNQVLEGSVGKVDARGPAKRKGRMAGKHVRVWIARGQVPGDVERVVVREVLLHSREIRADPHSRDDPAGILTSRSQEGPTTRNERRLSPSRVEHAAELRIGPMTSGTDDDRLARSDVYRLRAIVDVAVLPEALQ